MFSVKYVRTQGICTEYKIGEKLHIQCLNTSNLWGPGPKCEETGEEIYFQYGVDTFLYCGLAVPTQEFYQYLKRLVVRDENWSCRIAMAPDHEFYVPFTIPIWGVAEPDHMHIDNHLNWIFHADGGKILGVSAYPVRDRFQLVVPKSVITLHGAAKWFWKESFRDFSSSGYIFSTISPFGTGSLIFIWCTITFIFSWTLFGFAFRYYLRPKILRRVLKRD